MTRDLETTNIEAKMGRHSPCSRLVTVLALSVSLAGCGTWQKFTSAIDDVFTGGTDESVVAAAPVDAVTVEPLEDLAVTDEEDSTDQPGAAYLEGKEHFGAGRLGLALTSFRTALRGYPDSVKTLNGLGATYDQLGRYDLAQRYYERALRAAPESGVTLNNLGYSYILRAGKYGDQRYYAMARTYLERASTLGNAHPAVVANLESIQSATRITQLPLSTPKPTNARIALASADPYSAWVERRSERVSYLVTRPARATVEEAKRLRLLPAVAVYSSQRGRPGS